MANDFDVIDATKRCVDRLQELGLLEWHDKLIDAIDCASTGGELVMGVRYHLRGLRESGISVPDDVSELIRDIIDAIDGTGW